MGPLTLTVYLPRLAVPAFKITNESVLLLNVIVPPLSVPLLSVPAETHVQRYCKGGVPVATTWKPTLLLVPPACKT